MEFEWDEEKNKSNIKKHGLSFEEVRDVFLGILVTSMDIRLDYGETRYISIGILEDIIVIVVIHTNRNGRVRLISARLAKEKERRQYYEFIKKEN
ncbi:hypothetical protein DID80_07705 [Candidatus Marinamargulisbacteria bacterium SCGC AAA071-K20]|nr:hypothetical protein DID80_07705 [Candidatus Marinamargulisbacteria bacterium SCGC AAA071-K20]